MDLDLSVVETLEKRVEGKSFGSLVLKYRRPTKEQMDRVDGLTTVGAARQRMGRGITAIDDAAAAYARMFRYKAETTITGWDDVWEICRDKDGNIIQENGAPTKKPLPFSFTKLMAACGRYPELSEEVSLISNALYAGLDPNVKSVDELEEQQRGEEEEAKNLEQQPEATSSEAQDQQESTPSSSDSSDSES